MPNQYLQSGDFATYGVDGSTTTAQVVRAGVLIDGYLQREEGLLYTADSNGNPCYMSALSPRFSLTIQADIAPGENVSVNVTGACDSIVLGTIGIIDRTGSNSTNLEPLVILSLTKVNNTTYTIVFKNVVNAHSNGAVIDFGLLIYEEIDMPSGRPICKVFKTPLVNILSGSGRYSFARRSDTDVYMVYQYNLLAQFTTPGSPPIWEIFTPSNNMFNTNTGEVWVPGGMFQASFTQIRLEYISGFTYANLPGAIKQACANLINVAANDSMVSGIKTLQAGGTRIERFGNSLIDNDTAQLLNPYKARLFV